MLEEEHREEPLPGKIKIGISGCPRSCGMSHTRDIGIIGTPKGWKVMFGGNNGLRPRFGEVIAKDLTTDEAQDLISRLLGYYKAHARPKERTARFMERITMENLNHDLLDGIPYLAREN
jgi:NAD(P)H-nitrite reductase large subunit